MNNQPNNQQIEMGWNLFQQGWDRRYGNDDVEKDLNLAIQFFRQSIEISGNWYSYDHLPDVLDERGLPGDAQEAENVRRQFHILNELLGED